MALAVAALALLALSGAGPAAPAASPAPDPALARPLASGGGVAPLPGDLLSPVTVRAIEERLAANRARLRDLGRRPGGGATATLFDWPLRLAPGQRGPGYHGISNYVDLDPAFPAMVLDFACGARSYDLASGYNHGGTDLFTWPFPWRRMDQDAVEVVAAAGGTIVGRDDGNFDRSCGFSGEPWNAVYVEHGDGSVLWYGHLKSGSLTAKGVGDTVAAGEYLGVVGSSGSSTGPHLHLELHAPGVVEPWAGPCNSTTPVSWWAVQPPYYDPAVLLLTTGDAVADFPGCPGAEDPREAFVFHPGDVVYFTRYYRDQLQGVATECTIRRPDGSIYAAFTDAIGDPHYAASWLWNSYLLGHGEPLGEWSWEVRDARGVDHLRPFWVVAGPWLLRHALGATAPPAPPLAAVFTGSGAESLELRGRDGAAEPGEGDDDDAYLPGLAPGQADPDAGVVGDALRPLVFYQAEGTGNGLRLVKSGGTVVIAGL